MVHNIIHEEAIPYKNKLTCNENFFKEFFYWATKNTHPEIISESKKNNTKLEEEMLEMIEGLEYLNYSIIQLVKYHNFEPNKKEINYYKKNGSEFKEVFNISKYRKANSYKNYKTKKNIGHINGLFYELNLYKLQK